MQSAAAKASSTIKFGAVTATVIPTGVQVDGIVASPDGKSVYVANTLSNTVSIINAADGTKVKDIKIYTPPRLFETKYQGWEPSKLAVSDDGKYLYVFNKGGTGSSLEAFLGPIFNTPSVSVIDIEKGEVISAGRVSPLGALSTLSMVRQVPTSITVGPGHLYVTNLNDKNPSFGTFIDGQIRWNRYVVVDRFAEEALECTTSRCPLYNQGELSAWSQVRAHVIPKIGIGVDWAAGKIPFIGGIIKLGDLLMTRPAGIAVAPAGGSNYVYSINRGSDLVYVFDPITNTMVDAFFTGGMVVKDKTLHIGNMASPVQMKFSRDGLTGYILTSDTRELVRVNTDPANIVARKGVQIIDRTVLFDDSSSRLWPVDMATTADGRYAVVLSEEGTVPGSGRYSSMLTIVDLEDNKVVSSLPLYRRGAQISVKNISLVGTKAFITTESDKWFASTFRNGEVIAVDIPNDAFVRRVE